MGWKPEAGAEGEAAGGTKAGIRGGRARDWHGERTGEVVIGEGSLSMEGGRKSRGGFGLAKEDKERANEVTLQARFWAEQPSIPKPGLVSPVNSSIACLHACFTGWSGFS